LNRKEARGGDFAYREQERWGHPVATVRVQGERPQYTYERMVTACGEVDAATLAVLRRLARQGLV
jgi:hypothetical protein